MLHTACQVAVVSSTDQELSWKQCTHSDDFLGQKKNRQKNDD